MCVSSRSSPPMFQQALDISKLQPSFTLRLRRPAVRCEHFERTCRARRSTKCVRHAGDNTCRPVGAPPERSLRRGCDKNRFSESVARSDCTLRRGESGRRFRSFRSLAPDDGFAKLLWSSYRVRLGYFVCLVWFAREPSSRGKVAVNWS